MVATLKNSENVILIPTLDEGLITPICESMQAVIWHLIVSHPDIKVNQINGRIQMELNDKIVNKLINLRTEIYADGANISEIKELAKSNFIQGLTTNLA